LISSCLEAQDFNLGLSAVQDENIFDIYIPTTDRIAQFQMNFSDDWYADPVSFDLSYTGELFFYRDLSARNYNVHYLNFNTMYQIYSDDDGPEGSDDPENAGDSSGAHVQIPPLVPPAHVDSLDNYLYLDMFAIGQFDGDAYAEYDNSHFGGVLSLRQPVGTVLSIKPSFMFAYNKYRNLSGFTNFENVLSLSLSAPGVLGGSMSTGVSYGKKNYTTTATYTYVVEEPGNNGHGKGGAGGSKNRTVTTELTTPSVSQSSFSAEYRRPITPTTVASLMLSYYGTPSTVARSLPNQLGGAGAQSDIFDDHYSYSGPLFSFRLSQILQADFTIGLQGLFQSKEYTTPAMDLLDSVVVADHRMDHRQEYVISVSKAFSAGAGKSIRPVIEYHYFNNDSNAEYYAFTKNVYILGLEFDF
jgi:hypothetical protein